MAHVPQDFNFEVCTGGNIRGVNPGDSKLMAMGVKVHSTGGGVTARRIKVNDCHLEAAGGVQISSSLEAHHLRCQAGPAGFVVNKRLGVGAKARVDSAGHVRIGSAFSMMR